MIKVNIFIRKKTKYFQNSIERFAKELKKNNNKNMKINILECPVESKGLLNRIYLIFWSFFSQGDVNHILGDINYINLLMDKKRTISTYLDCRLLNEFKGIKAYVYKILWFKLSILKSKYITFISSFTKNEIKKKLNTNFKNSFVIPVPLVSNLSFKRNFNKKKKILIVGTLKHKNIKNMLLSTEGLKIDLNIVGGIEQNLKKICEKRNIKFKNFIGISDNKMKNLFKNSDILLMASNYEGFGMPIIEAQASGMVVITSNKEPMKSLSGGSAILVNPNKIADIKKAILKIVSNDKLFELLIKKGFINSNKYKSSEVLKKYHDLYFKICKKHQLS